MPEQNETEQNKENALSNESVLIDKELAAYQLILEQFRGLTLQQAYNALLSAKGYLEVIGENVDADEFVFGQA